MPDVNMPRLSDSMEEGTIVRWLRSDGDVVQKGEPLVEIETDKATMTLDADLDGPLAIVAREGETVELGALIARIGAAPATQQPTASPVLAVGGSAPGASAVTAGSAPASADRTATRGKASPVARRIAAELGLELSILQGSGPRGRIVKADVLAAAGPLETSIDSPRRLSASTAAAPVASPSLLRASDGRGAAEDQGSVGRGVAEDRAGDGRGAVRVEDLSRMQRAIAQRMVASRTDIPEFAIEVDVEMGPALELRARLKEVAKHPPSLNDLIVKAAARACVCTRESTAAMPTAASSCSSASTSAWRSPPTTGS